MTTDRRIFIVLSVLTLFVVATQSPLIHAQETTPTQSPTTTATAQPTSTVTQTPAVTPPVPPPNQPPVSICDRTPSYVATGGSIVSLDNVSFALPLNRGQFGVSFILSNPGPNSILICYRDGNGGIAINASTGMEVRREGGDAGANTVLDEIMAAVRRGAQSPPQNRITAPDTGGGGLR